MIEITVTSRRKSRERFVVVVVAVAVCRVALTAPLLTNTALGTMFLQLTDAM